MIGPLFRTLVLLGALAPLGLAALPAPHDDASGVGCGDCHQIHAGDPNGSWSSITTGAGTTTSLVDGTQAWQPDFWVGGVVTLTSGLNDGQVREIIANTRSSISWLQPLPSGVAVGETFSLARDRENETQILCQGCHNPTGPAASMSDVGLHVTADGTTVGCGKCHDPHNVTPNSGVGASLIRETIRWPTANNPVTFPAPGNRFVTGSATYNGICETCHTQASYHRNDATGDHLHNAATPCTDCHSHVSGFSTFDHEAQGAVTTASTCMDCHAYYGLSTVNGVHRAQCYLCHVDPAGGGPLVAPHETTHPAGGDCLTCHGSQAAAHAGANHTAAPPQAEVAIFEDNWHDDAGWGGARPYFGVLVDCDTCHNLDIGEAHANECTKCHFATVDALGTWGGTCQQGGCHATFHLEESWAHGAWEDYTQPPGSNCILCHATSGGGGTVSQTKCANCHTDISGGDSTPPVTTSDAVASYTGTARITFDMTDSGKVGIGTTYFRLDGGVIQTGITEEVTAAGAHSLEFWSVDQFGNVESPPKVANFTITADSTPPVTTSNAVSTYWQGGTITLSATDNSTEGVKATHYTLNGGPTQTGTTVSIPNLTGTFAYTLVFWSEDWSGNVESPPNTANFTATGGTATIRLIWGNSEIDGPPTHPLASAYWYIRRNSSTGYLQASGSGANPGWSGVNDHQVPVSPTPYWIKVHWHELVFDGYDETIFTPVPVTVPGEVIRINY